MLGNLYSLLKFYLSGEMKPKGPPENVDFVFGEIHTTKYQN